MALPFLPGNSRNTRLGKERFHKSQHFDYTNGFPMLVGSEKPGIGGERLMPAWLAFDKQVISIMPYFQEAVQEVQEGRNRIRKCKIYFYLEDDTIQVVDPEYKNRGIPQGTLICRQRIPLPPPRPGALLQHLPLQHQPPGGAVLPHIHRDQLQGVLLNAPAEAPADPYCILRQQLEDSMKPLRPYERHDTLRHFLDHDGKVLRFYCLWDDTESAFGERRELVLHYFLSDDTIEILEVVPAQLRERRPRPGSCSAAGLFCLHSVRGLHPVQYKAPPAPKPPRPVPPYNGFGSEEDSLSSCRGLAAQAAGAELPRKDGTTDPVDQERLFHVSYHLCDDTISVFERPFLLRCRVKKPGQDLFKSELSEYFTAPDLYVGATLCLGGRSFRILEADEFTLNYMQQRADEVRSQASVFRGVGIRLLACGREADYMVDPCSCVSRSLLTGLDCGLSEHEVLVLGRGFWERPQPEPDLGLMLAVAQDLLRKNHFEQFPHLVREFTHQDPEK
uniref:EF-hand domain (C-terminal) containing 2 n=1 Tax=Salarias fasciatus TaxID=181472 RepID=A0A672ID17_SALFA